MCNYVDAVAAVMAVANVLRSSLGPHGLDKMLVDDIGNSFLSTLYLFLSPAVSAARHPLHHSTFSWPLISFLCLLGFVFRPFFRLSACRRCHRNQ